MKHIRLKRHLSLFLALLMVMGVLFGTVACVDNDEDNDSGETTAAKEEETDANAAYSTVAKKNYNGATFMILTRGDQKDDMYVDDGITGDVLNDKIVERNRAVETDFNVKIVCQTKDGHAAVNDTVKLQALSPTNEYDMYVGHKYSFAALAQNNYCYDLNMITELALDQPWWDQGCYENLTVSDRTYMMTGDINPYSMRISSCFVFNKKLMENLGKNVQELNDLAKAGGWTLDTLYAYTEGVTRDTSGDGQMSYTDDRYGLTAWMMDAPFSLFYGAGGMFVGRDEEGEPALNYSNERIYDIYEKMYNVIVGQKAYFVTDSAQYETTYDVFSEGRALFCDITLGKITTFISDMKDPYGILPTPKYEASQDEYLSFVNGAAGFVMVGKNVEDTSYVGTIIEAMATYNYDKVTPHMFQVVTKLQAAQDPESAAMVDLIIRNRIFDLGYYCDYGVANVPVNALKDSKDVIASLLKRAHKKDETSLREMVTAFQGHN